MDVPLRSETFYASINYYEHYIQKKNEGEY